MTQQAEALAVECADYATSLRSTINVVRLEGRPAPESMLRAADLFERAAARITDLERWQEDVRSNSPLLARLEHAEQRVQELEARQAVPHGWKLVPIEPTEAQLATVRSQKSHPCAPDRWDSNHRRIYMHMLAAAPLPPGGEPIPLRDGGRSAAAKPKHQDYWICLLCGSSRPGHHRTLDDGTTPCPNMGKA